MESSTVAPTSSVGGRHVIVTEESKDSSIKAMGYYDIMILGLTGQGKTTTADKLLIANPTGVDYQSEYAEESEATPQVDPVKQRVTMQDLYMWLIPNDEAKIKEISVRIKDLAFQRVLTDPHKQVNENHASEKHVTTRTMNCELLSNETTKLRVLDVPGFFGEVRNAGQDSHNITLNAKETHLSTMRNILQIQAALAMKFKRILYFLPCRDTLQISNAALQQELQLMCYYFGRSIFEVMVVVATLGPTIYSVLPKNVSVEMPNEELERSRAVFRDVLKSFVPVDTPNPPIIFISLRETCESILDKIKKADIANKDGLQLRLSSTVCARCSMTIGERKGTIVAVASDGNWSESILYEDSLCHPFFEPKYTTIEKVAEAVKAVARREVWQWPDFSVEKCYNCGRPPGSPGCLKVGTVYSIDEETRIVDHTSIVEEYASKHRWLFQDDSESVSATGQSQGEDVQPTDSEEDGENREELPLESSAGFETSESESAEQREVPVDIEPWHNPEAALVTRTRISGAAVGDSSSVPDIQVLNSEKK